MRGKPIRNKNKILVALVALFTMLMCTSVGFAAWITTGGSNSIISGNIEADDVFEGGSGGSDVIAISSLQNYEYKQSYGFVDNGIFGAVVETFDEDSCLFGLDASHARLGGEQKQNNLYLTKTSLK